MSGILLDRIKAHLDEAGLLAGYTVRHYRWSDLDLNGQGDVILFRMAGSEGASDRVAQEPDVTIQVLCSPSRFRQGDERMRRIVQRFRTVPIGQGVVHMEPVSAISGPITMDNGRQLFDFTLRATVEDH